MRILALSIALMIALPGLASAQVYHGLNDPALTAERHRLANERARMQAEQRAADAQRQQLQTQLTLQRLEADRQRQAQSATDAQASIPSGVRSSAQARAAREAATARREAQTASTTQIDSWLDRAPQ